MYKGIHVLNKIIFYTFIYLFYFIFVIITEFHALALVFMIMNIPSNMCEFQAENKTLCCRN